MSDLIKKIRATQTILVTEYMPYMMALEFGYMLTSI